LNLYRPGGTGARIPQTYHLRVVSNRNVTTFIKELLLEPVNPGERITFTPGDYLQFDIPAYEKIEFREFDIPAPFSEVWTHQHLFDLKVRNPGGSRRNNYSLASNQNQNPTCVSTFASPIHRPARIALRESDQATCSL
jgi:Na+-transporting NADH:ubiquinone oxidoreductase subunit F